MSKQKKVLFEIVRYQTSDKLDLKGLLTMPEKAKGVFIYLHGLTSGPFSSLGTNLATHLFQEGYGTLLTETRGSGIVSSFTKEDKRAKGGTTYITGGTAHEVFTDSTLDVQATVDFLKSRKIKTIYLIGSSTGCQKSIYYLAQRGKQQYIDGVVLLAPLSDYAVFKHEMSTDEFELRVLYAQRLVQQDKGDELLPAWMTDFPLSAQRFVSLATPDSEEEIFTYASEQNPALLQKVKVPMLVMLAEKDEYSDRPVLELVEWFEDQVAARQKRVVWIEGADHGFTGKEKEVAEEIVDWV